MEMNGTPNYLNRMAETMDFSGFNHSSYMWEKMLSVCALSNQLPGRVMGGMIPNPAVNERYAADWY
jgi:hypothetical protein